jgi:DNA repair exonuclease SbcCD ATPase subunit
MGGQRTMSNILTDKESFVWAREWNGGAGRVTGELWKQAEREAGNLITHLVYYAKARQALARLEPLVEKAHAELERHQQRHDDLHAAWLAGKDKLQELRTAYHATTSRIEKDTLANGIGDLERRQAENAKQLVTHDHDTPTFIERATGIAQAVEALRSVEPPSAELAGVFRQWLGLGDPPQPEPEPQQRGRRRK